MKVKYLIKYKFLFKLYLIIFYLKFNFFTLKKSYSQFGEDLIIKKFFKSFKGRYVDIGCYHPIKYNNTVLLYKNGWTGINIDLNQTTIDLFNASRKKDTNVLACLSNSKNTVNLYFVSEFSALNSIHQDNLKHFGIKNFKKKKIKTKLFSEVVKKNFDFLNIDCEGHDFKILKTIDLDIFTPKLICIEVNKKNKNLIYNYLFGYGYKLLARKTLSHIFYKKKL